MTNYKEILRLTALGISKQDIAASCQCSRNTVHNVLNAAAGQNISWLTASKSSNEALRQLLFPGSSGKVVYRMPDYEYVHHEMQKNGVTLSLLWVEYCEQCQVNGDIPYQSTQFNKYYSNYVHEMKATMHLDHKIGDTMQVDWAGQTGGIIDSDTGKIIPVYLFVSVLPYSGYAYVEACLDMKSMLMYMPISTSAVLPGCWCLTISRPACSRIQKMKRSLTEATGKWQSTTGQPSFPPDPEYKRTKLLWKIPSVSCLLGFWQPCGTNSSSPLEELNAAIQDKLYDFNHKPFQKKEGSRAEAFEEEKPFLLPLPASPFEIASWKIATVQYNYHLSVKKQNYSVPYEYIKQKVDVQITSHTVEVFFDGNRIASHPRLHGRPNQYSTFARIRPATTVRWSAATARTRSGFTLAILSTSWTTLQSSFPPVTAAPITYL